MKRSEINQLIRDASACLKANGWAIPPLPRWDITDFGLGSWSKHGLVLLNLTEEPEYCEKLMYARHGMVTPAHMHRVKKEDIVCRWGELSVTFWHNLGLADHALLEIKQDGYPCTVRAGEPITLYAGERVTIAPGIVHSFVPVTEEVIIGEVSTANDDLHDNFFADSSIGRFPAVDEDEPAIVKLVSDG